MVDSTLDCEAWSARAWYLKRCWPREFGKTVERPLPGEPETKQISVAFILETGGKTIEELTNFPVKSIEEVLQRTSSPDDADLQQDDDGNL